MSMAGLNSTFRGAIVPGRSERLSKNGFRMQRRMKKMRTQTKAVIASVAVLAMLLSTVGGVTYSWFADTRSTDIETGTADVSYSQDLVYDTVSMGTSDVINVTNTAGEHTLTVEVTNKGSVPVVYSSKFLAERYSAYDAAGYTTYKADYIMGANGNLTQDTKGSWSGGFFQNNLQAFQVKVDGNYESVGISTSSDSDGVYAAGMNLELDGATTSLNVKLTKWWIANDDLVIMPGYSATLSFSLQYTKTITQTVTGGSEGETTQSRTIKYNSNYAPTVRFVSSCVQVDSYEAVRMAESNGTLAGSIEVKQSHAGYVFYEGESLENSKTRIVIGWDAINIKSSDGKTLTVTVEAEVEGKEVIVSGEGCSFTTGGRISYTLNLGTGVSSVSPMSNPMTVWVDNTYTLVSFSDSTGTLAHTVSYATSTNSDP